MLELGEGSIDVAGHGDVDIAGVVVPVQGESAVEQTGPVGSDLIVFVQGGDEMEGVCFGEVFYPKVIYSERKCCLLSGVAPEAGGEGCWFVAVWCEFCDELFKGKNAGFFEPVYAATDF